MHAYRGLGTGGRGLGTVRCDRAEYRGRLLFLTRTGSNHTRLHIKAVEQPALNTSATFHVSTS